MPPELEIAPVTPRDVREIVALETAAFPVPWRREFFESELAADGRFLRLAREEGRLVGYVFAMWFLDEMHINKIAVASSHRRRGIAAALMDHCFAFARKHDVQTISLEVRETNEGAQEFYRSLGFARAYVRPRYYPDGEGAVVMMRKL